MSNRKDYIFAPGGLNLSWAALLRDYPDGANRCFLVALDERQISVLLDLADLMKWAWLWGINYKLEQNQWLLVEQFRQETRDALMSGCDVSMLIDAVNGVAGAIEDLTGAIGGSPSGDPPVTVVSSLTGVIEAIGDIPGPADLTGVIEAIGTIPGPADLSGVETALLPLASLSTLLAPLEDLSYLQNLTYLEKLELLERLENIVAIMSVCCGKTQVPADIMIPIIFEDEGTRLNYRCRAANYIWYTLYTVSSNMNTQYIAGIATEESQNAIAALKALIAIFPPAWGGEALAGLAEGMLALMRSLGAINPFSNVVSSLNTNKTAFIAALYNSETDQARDAAVGTLTGLNLIDYGFLYQIFPKGAARIMDNPIDFDTPPNPVICAAGILENTCGYQSLSIGSPDLVDGDIIYGGNITPVYSFNPPFSYQSAVQSILPHKITVTSILSATNDPITYGELRFNGPCDGENMSYITYNPPTDYNGLPVDCFGFSFACGETFTLTFTSETL